MMQQKMETSRKIEKGQLLLGWKMVRESMEVPDWRSFKACGTRALHGPSLIGTRPHVCSKRAESRLFDPLVQFLN